MNALERRYRRLLLAYPRDYRRANGEQLVATLLETGPDRRVPRAREAVALVSGGLGERAHAAVAGPRPWWVDGLHLALPPLILAGAVSSYWSIFNHPWSGALFVLSMLAVVLGWVRVALPFALVPALLASTPYPALGDPTWGWLQPLAYGFGGRAWSNLLLLWAAVGLLAVLAVRGDRLRRRSPLWLAGVLAVVAYGVLVATTGPWWTLTRAGVEIALLGVGVAATLRTRDARWAVAASAYLLCAMAPLVQYPIILSWRSASYWGLLLGLTFATAVLARRPVRVG
ncbi:MULTISPECIES: hypothetical protein [Actinomadura]|uniref:Integral membrane protein n=1 Tax=Actinomadura yumaensis TaxID=111807 RepID=A0ABW2CFK4_9ACTN|nr:hypothetical protein [Actinomadura sp. J1-007]MWK38495.1 hypothetical protein [Actinomadura sp. J1-007]